MQHAVDEGWRLRWWTLPRNPNLASIRSAGLDEILAPIRDQMAAQLEELRQRLEDDPLMTAPP